MASTRKASRRGRVSSDSFLLFFALYELCNSFEGKKHRADVYARFGGAQIESKHFSAINKSNTSMGGLELLVAMPHLLGHEMS